MDTIDPNEICMVKSRFSCNVWLSPENTDGVNVCLRMKTLSTLFRHISANHMLHLQRRRGSMDLILRVFHRFDQTSSMEFVLKTLEQPMLDASITDIESQYTVEMMLAQCKTMFKMGKDIKAGHMRFEIFEDKDDKDKQTFFCISGEGEEATARYTFQSATKEEKTQTGQTIYALQQQTTSPAVDAMNRVYYENFSTEFLNLFLKSMEKQTVQITLASNGPLILHYQLGADQSVVRFILAPQERRTRNKQRRAWTAAYSRCSRYADREDGGARAARRRAQEGAQRPRAVHGGGGALLRRWRWRWCWRRRRRAADAQHQPPRARGARPAAGAGRYARLRQGASASAACGVPQRGAQEAVPDLLHDVLRMHSSGMCAAPAGGTGAALKTWAACRHPSGFDSLKRETLLRDTSTFHSIVKLERHKETGRAQQVAVRGGIASQPKAAGWRGAAVQHIDTPYQCRL